jgi:hypothetical protein
MAPTKTASASGAKPRAKAARKTPAARKTASTARKSTSSKASASTSRRPTSSKASASSARRPASSKASKARTRSAAGSTQAKGTTQAKATRAKAARTRATHQTEAALRSAQTATRDTAEVVGDYAERAVLIPVGAALVARDRVVSSVSDTISTYSSSSKTQAQLRRFERRGTTARNRLEREVRKARVRFERELRQRRREIESTVNDLESRRGAVANRVPEIKVPEIKVADITTRVPELANRVQERILSLV